VATINGKPFIIR